MCKNLDFQGPPGLDLTTSSMTSDKLCELPKSVSSLMRRGLITVSHMISENFN